MKRDSSSGARVLVLALPDPLSLERRAAVWARIAATLPGPRPRKMGKTADPGLHQTAEATAAPAG